MALLDIGLGQAQDRELSTEAGFHAHLVKPVELALLREVLSGLVPRGEGG